MKKIAILTLVFNNYGTRLQSYALCKVLNEILSDKAKIDVINMETPWVGLRGDSKKKIVIETFKKYGFQGFLHIYEMIKWIYLSRKIEKENHDNLITERQRLFEKTNALIPYTKCIYNIDEIRKGALSDYGTFIVGSDQVWNCIKVPIWDIFMLNFSNDKQKCLTYAASFGLTNLPNQIINDYKKSIQKFHTLFVREEEGVEICKKLGRTDAIQVLDPTLLLKEKDYGAIMDNSEDLNIEGKYILVYSLNQSFKIYDEAYRLCETTNSKLVVLKRGFRPPFISKYKNSIELYAISPGGFLKLIKGAECVITNSYHALIFSINFNVPFYMYLNNIDEENSRLLTISRKFNLEDRVFYETGHLPKRINLIDYDDVNVRLANEIERSKALLEESINKFIL